LKKKKKSVKIPSISVLDILQSKSSFPSIMPRPSKKDFLKVTKENVLDTVYDNILKLNLEPYRHLLYDDMMLFRLNVNPLTRSIGPFRDAAIVKELVKKRLSLLRNL